MSVTVYNYCERKKNRLLLKGVMLCHICLKVLGKVCKQSNVKFNLLRFICLNLGKENH